MAHLENACLEQISVDGYMTYDEIKVATLVQVSGPVKPINRW